jgi:hypothetical protein
MTRKYFILIILMFLASCEKGTDNNDIILKYYGDALEDIGYSIAEYDGGYFIAGQLTEVSRTVGNLIDNAKSVKKMGIIKTDKDGNVVKEGNSFWSKKFGNKVTSLGTKLIVLDDGSVVCTGYVIDTINNLKDIFVVKTDAGGTNSIEKIYKNTGNQYGIDIIKTQEGFLVLGSTDVERQPLTDSTGNAAGKKDLLLLRINNNLDPINFQTGVGLPPGIGFPGNDAGVALKKDINGGYIVVGTTDRSELKPNLQAGNNIFLLRINTDGSATQPRIIGGTLDEYAADIEVLNNGYLIAGTIGSEGSGQYGYVWGISENIYSTPLFEPHAIIIDDPNSGTKSSFSVKAISRYRTNSFVMAGQILIGSSVRMLVFVTDGEGNFVDGKKNITGGTGIQIAYDVISDADANIIAVGKNSYENNSMISLLKFKF